ncbi:MAG: hypothetical protein H7A25_14300 [Leptospiraceae bacterium]|nr:hypothetical protein [Leptospiraceae bacterium]MCP5501075.1 hypothetical protein [Leptospiraceae bacterium]
MINEILEPVDKQFEEVVENLLKIIDTYEVRQKVEIISRISNSILKQGTEEKKKEELFYSCFGSWDTEESADELIDMIYSSRTQREREVDL